MNKIQVWVSSLRLRTLPLSISGILIGSSFAYYNGFFNYNIFILAILTTIFLQILSNLANDYGDGVKGTDNKNRIGPERALQSGKISAKEMKLAIIINIIINGVNLGATFRNQFRALADEHGGDVSLTINNWVSDAGNAGIE